MILIRYQCGSGLYGEDDPGLHESTNSGQSRNSVESLELSDPPQETHYHQCYH